MAGQRIAGAASSSRRVLGALVRRGPERRPPVEPGTVAVRARNVDFDWGRTPLIWMPDEPIASHAFNALNMVLPEGERMIIQAFEEALPSVRDEAIREDILGFIGQELMHAEAHSNLLDEVLRRHGIDPSPFVAQMEYMFRNTLGPGDGTDARRDRQRLVERLGVSAAAEHIFAYLGDWILGADLERFGADPVMLDLFRWHGAEEVEHRSVAHDVAVYFGVGYLRRCTAMALTFPGFFMWHVRGTKYLVDRDPSLPDMGYPRLLAAIGGAMWRGALPSLPSLLWAGLSTTTPGFDPQSVGSTARALAYIAQSPAAQKVAW
ncbi:metal-dependent hydrolase [Nocardia asteroides]|uniref:metal-dependent hydrolase n=1 Tax=Nocardia asteroides TaxID=1824 RepID=UPI0037A52358